MTSVSVIMPVHNQENRITRALESIPEGWQVIIIDDASTDGTADKIESWKDANYTKYDISVLTNPFNIGVGKSENEAINFVKGDYWVRLDSDDYFLPAINDVAAQLDPAKYDIVSFNLIDDRNITWNVSIHNEQNICGPVKFIRTAFQGDLRSNGARNGADYALMLKLRAKNPRRLFTGITATHYTYPREGSITWNIMHGLEP